MFTFIIMNLPQHFPTPFIVALKKGLIHLVSPKFSAQAVDQVEDNIRAWFSHQTWIII